MKNQTPDNNFTTSDFYVAAFLIAYKYQLVGINKTDARRFRFVFIDQPGRPQFIEGYFLGREMVVILQVLRLFLGVLMILADPLLIVAVMVIFGPPQKCRRNLPGIGFLATIIKKYTEQMLIKNMVSLFVV